LHNLVTSQILSEGGNEGKSGRSIRAEINTRTIPAGKSAESMRTGKAGRRGKSRVKSSRDKNPKKTTEIKSATQETVEGFLAAASIKARKDKRTLTAGRGSSSERLLVVGPLEKKKSGSPRVPEKKYKWHKTGRGNERNIKKGSEVSGLREGGDGSRGPRLHGIPERYQGTSWYQKVTWKDS